MRTIGVLMLVCPLLIAAVWQAGRVEGAMAINDVVFWTTLKYGAVYLWVSAAYVMIFGKNPY